MSEDFDWSAHLYIVHQACACTVVTRVSELTCSSNAWFLHIKLFRSDSLSEDMPNELKLWNTHPFAFKQITASKPDLPRSQAAKYHLAMDILIVSQLAFYVNLHRAVIGPSATLTGRWRPDIDLRRMLTGLIGVFAFLGSAVSYFMADNKGWNCKCMWLLDCHIIIQLAPFCMVCLKANASPFSL